MRGRLRGPFFIHELHELHKLLRSTRRCRGLCLSHLNASAYFGEYDIRINTNELPSAVQNWCQFEPQERAQLLEASGRWCYN